MVTLLSEGRGANASVLNSPCSGTFDSIFVPWSWAWESGMSILIMWAKFRFLITCGELPSAFWELYLGCVLGHFWVCLFLPSLLRGGCLFFSSHPDAIYMWLMFSCPVWVSPAPCMGKGHPDSPSVPLMWFVSIKMGSHFLQRPFYLVHFRDLEGWRYLIILWQLILAIYKIPLNLFYWFIIKITYWKSIMLSHTFECPSFHQYHRWFMFAGTLR